MKHRGCFDVFKVHSRNAKVNVLMARRKNGLDVKGIKPCLSQRKKCDFDLRVRALGLVKKNGALWAHSELCLIMKCQGVFKCNSSIT